MKLAALIAALAMSIVGVLVLAAFAQPTPKPTPVPTQSMCLNKQTGAIRDLLSTSKAACHPNEIAVSVDTLLATQATPAPTNGVPSPTATAVPSASATPVADVPSVIDANGKVVGMLDQDSADAQEGAIVVIDINGVPLGLQVSQDGFVDEQASGVQLDLWYPTTDCTGQGYIIVAGDGNGLAIQPLVEVTGPQRGPYIFGNTVWYAQPPWSNVTMNSFQAFTDPTQPSVSGCNSATGGLPNLGTWLVGPPASFNLSNLEFVAPFQVQ